MSQLAQEYLIRILNARVYDVAKETPLEYAAELSRRTQSRVLLKREDLQSIFSFKLRGAYNKMVQLSAQERDRGVIAASAGNHAQGVALSAAKLGCLATIVMPTTTPQVKVDAVRARGGSNVEIVLSGDSYSDAYQTAKEMEQQRGAIFIHPFDDPDVIAGQGTVAMEILRQHPSIFPQTDPVAIFVSVGGGGLISGVAAYIKALKPHIKVIGVQTHDSNAMYQSIQQGKRVALSEVGLFSDGTAVKLVGEETFRLVQSYVDEIICVSTDELCAAIKDVFQDTRGVLEPAGALSVAGLKAYADKHDCKDQSLIAITCGANMNFDRLAFVVERASVGEAKEALFAVSLPEQAGSLRRLCELTHPNRIKEFSYRMSNSETANMLFGLEFRVYTEAEKLFQILTDNDFKPIELTNDDLAKDHLRHLIGGKTHNNQDERIFRVEFPERPGVLLKFLQHMNPSWNISLCHYRDHGGDLGHCLVGILCASNEEKIAIDAFFEQSGYRYREETQHPAFQLLLR
jgi:threonine dehydratase